jgi:hypothetical protein
LEEWSDRLEHGVITEPPPDIAGVLASLLGQSAATSTLSLDAIGEALGDRPVSSTEIDWLIGALEEAGRRILGPEGRGGLEALRIVLPAARRLSNEHGKAPTVELLARATELPEREIRRALLLARTLGR